MPEKHHTRPCILGKCAFSTMRWLSIYRWQPLNGQSFELRRACPPKLCQHVGMGGDDCADCCNIVTLESLFWTTGMTVCFQIATFIAYNLNLSHLGIKSSWGLQVCMVNLMAGPMSAVLTPWKSCRDQVQTLQHVPWVASTQTCKTYHGDMNRTYINIYI